MSKMDRMLNSKKDTQTIYEIYRACRLCGAGAGYKMPIIQNVVDLDDTDVELKQKIRDCVQIEVHQDDKMPPLICELCVDKVNDFYEFLEMCRQTNKRTRLRLGLPPQSMPRGAPDAGECILGLTEPVYVNEDSDGEPLAKHKKMQPKVKVKKEPELKVKLENRLPDVRSSRFKSSKRPPTPPRTTRLSRNSRDDITALSRFQDKSKSPKGTPKSILKKDSKPEDNSLMTSRLKRTRDKEPVKLETPTKKVKIAVKSSPPSKTSPRSSKLKASNQKPPPKRPPSPPRTYKCSVCAQINKTPQANSNHLRSHTVTFTALKLACNPCGLWFTSGEEANSHHRHHKNKSVPYTCRRCVADFRYLSAYDEHLNNNQCIPWDEVPDVKCDVCWHLFATNKLLDDHRCLGEDHRPGGKCGKCNRSYALLKNLKKHELTCTAKKKGELVVDPALLGQLKPIQVRVSRCDPLLNNVKQEHYIVSSVTADYGLDKNCYYPYLYSSLRIKSESDAMVAIKNEIKDEFCSAEAFVHWDSDDSKSDEEISCSEVLNPLPKKKCVDTLATLTLKTLFSPKCLGKVPRKRRKVKQEKSAFDSLLNDTEDDVTRDINNIISNLGDDDGFDALVNDGKERNDREYDDSPVIDINFGKSDSQDNVDGQNGDDKICNDDSVAADNVSREIDSKECSSEVESQVDEREGDGKPDGNDESQAKVSDGNNESMSKDENDVNDADGNHQSRVNDDSDSKNEEVSAINTDKSIDISENIDQNTNIDKSDETTDSNVDTVNDNRDNVNDLVVDNHGTVKTNDIDKDDTNSAENSASVEKKDINNLICNNECNDTTGANNLSSVNDKINNGLINNNSNPSNDNSKVINENNDSVANGQDADSVSTINENAQNDTVSDNGKIDDHGNENINKDFSASDPKAEIQTAAERMVSVIVNNEKPKIHDSDLDDSNLMAALDAEIGEGTDGSHENHEVSDKIALEDLISSKTIEKPMDLDIIPDEFNFDQ